MDKYRRVEISHLDTFRIMLNQLKHDDGKKLLEYYDKYILQEKQAEINSLKRVLYSLMTAHRNTGNEEVSKKYYLLYQDLKNNKVTVDEALELYQKILE
jgi:hypothetical protein